MVVPEDGEFVTLLLETRELDENKSKIRVERDLTKQEMDTLEFLFTKKKVGVEHDSFDTFFASCPRIVCDDVDRPRLEYDDPGLVRKQAIVTLPYAVIKKFHLSVFSKNIFNQENDKKYFFLSFCNLRA